MTQRNDGGPAFPEQGERGKAAGGEGISVRDYMAAKAMQGLCGEAFRYMQGEGHATDGAIELMQDIGVVAYRVADAMLAEREQEES